MYTLSYSMDVASIGGIPQRSDMALMGFRGKEEFEGDVGGRGRVVQERVWLIVRADVGSEFTNLFFYADSACDCNKESEEAGLTLLFVEVVLLGYITGQR